MSKRGQEASPVLQWLRLCTPNAGDLTLTPGQRLLCAATKSLHAATKKSHCCN